MSLVVNINNITGSSPYDIYICQENGTGCFYIETISSVPYQFIIPPPYDTALSYMLKIIDNNGCVISGTTNLGPGVTPTMTPTVTPTNTPTPTSSFIFADSGYGMTEGEACVDKLTNARTFYSDCSVIVAGCYIYYPNIGTPLIGYTNVYTYGSNYDINPTNGQIIGLSLNQC